MVFRLKIASGPNAGQALALAEDSTQIAGQGDADITLPELGAQAQFRIERDGLQNTLTLHNQGQTDLWINNQPISDSFCPLNSGDELRLGTLRLVLQAPGLRPASVLAQVTDRKRSAISPWTWVAVATIAASGLAAMAVFVLSRLN